VPLAFDRLDRGVQGGEPLSVGRELQSFVRVFFGDGLDGGEAAQGSLAVVTASSSSGGGDARRVGTDPEVGKDGIQVVWVENAKTGLLVPVRLTDAEHDRRSGENAGEDDEERGTPLEGEDSNLMLLPPPLRSGDSSQSKAQLAASVESVLSFSDASGTAAQLTRVSFFLCQGLFAGFAFSTALALQSSTSSVNFLIDYEPLSSEYRKLFYLLSTLSAVGSLDNFMTALRKANRPSLPGQGPNGFGAAMVSREIRGSVTLAALAACFHFVAFVLSVIMTAFDVLISVKNGTTGSEASTGAWAASAMSQSSFSSALTSWENLDSARLVCAVLAWFVCCLLMWRDLLTIESRGKELVRLRDILSAWRARTCQLQGDEGIDNLDTQSLKRLIALQATGYERSSAALRVQEDLRLE